MPGSDGLRLGSYSRCVACDGNERRVAGVATDVNMQIEYPKSSSVKEKNVVSLAYDRWMDRWMDRLHVVRRVSTKQEDHRYGT